MTRRTVEEMNAPTEDVLSLKPTGEYKGYGTYSVVGQITPNRALLHYELGFLRTASFNIKRAKPSEMEHAIKILDKKILLISNTLHRVLTELGDIDPRHPTGEIEDDRETVVVTRTIGRGKKERVISRTTHRV